MLRSTNTSPRFPRSPDLRTRLRIFGPRTDSTSAGSGAACGRTRWRRAGPARAPSTLSSTSNACPRSTVVVADLRAEQNITTNVAEVVAVHLSWQVYGLQSYLLRVGVWGGGTTGGVGDGLWAQMKRQSSFVGPSEVLKTRYVEQTELHRNNHGSPQVRPGSPVDHF